MRMNAEAFFELDTGDGRSLDVYIEPSEGNDPLGDVNITLHEDAVHCVLVGIKRKSLRLLSAALTEYLRD